jgi:hypothetical protein
MNRAVLLALAVLSFAAPSAQAQFADPYIAPYCEPATGTELIYTDRAYLILPKSELPRALHYSYEILNSQQRAERFGQLLFNDAIEPWSFITNADGLSDLWPLRPEKSYTFDRLEQTTHEQVNVSLVVLGLEPVAVGDRFYRSWKVRRVDTFRTGRKFLQFLWYSPELCSLTAFTDSIHRLVRLERILHPGDFDYKRPVTRDQGHLLFEDRGRSVQ